MQSWQRMIASICNGLAEPRHVVGAEMHSCSAQCFRIGASHPLWLSVVLDDSASTFTPRFANSGSSLPTSPSSVVHTCQASFKDVCASAANADTQTARASSCGQDSACHKTDHGVMAYWGKVLWMAEQDGPAAINVLVETAASGPNALSAVIVLCMQAAPWQQMRSSTVTQHVAHLISPCVESAVKSCEKRGALLHATVRLLCAWDDIIMIIWIQVQRPYRHNLAQHWRRHGVDGSPATICRQMTAAVKQHRSLPRVPNHDEHRVRRAFDMYCVAISTSLATAMRVLGNVPCAIDAPAHAASTCLADGQAKVLPVLLVLARPHKGLTVRA